MNKDQSCDVLNRRNLWGFLALPGSVAVDEADAKKYIGTLVPPHANFDGVYIYSNTDIFIEKNNALTKNFIQFSGKGHFLRIDGVGQ